LLGVRGRLLERNRSEELWRRRQIQCTAHRAQGGSCDRQIVLAERLDDRTFSPSADVLGPAWCSMPSREATSSNTFWTTRVRNTDARGAVITLSTPSTRKLANASIEPRGCGVAPASQAMSRCKIRSYPTHTAKSEESRHSTRPSSHNEPVLWRLRPGEFHPIPSRYMTALLRRGDKSLGPS
jgi:hypothetical protein